MECDGPIAYLKLWMIWHDQFVFNVLVICITHYSKRKIIYMKGSLLEYLLLERRMYEYNQNLWYMLSCFQNYTRCCQNTNHKEIFRLPNLATAHDDVLWWNRPNEQCNNPFCDKPPLFPKNRGEKKSNQSTNTIHRFIMIESPKRTMRQTLLW